MGISDQSHPSPPATVRRDASELRRLCGDPRATGTDRRDEACRSDGRLGRAHERHGQPVLQLPDRAAAAIAVRPYLAGCQRSGPRLAARSRHAVQSIRGSEGTVAARRSGRCRQAPRLDRWASRHPSQAARQGMGADQRRREFRRDRLQVDKHLAPDATVTTDAGNFGSFVHRYIGFRQGQIFLSSVVGAMGSGIPMAVAAALRRPGTQIVAFLGDGGALMMGNEIATACQYGAAPIMIISDNAMYGTIGMHSYVRYPERPFMEGTRLTNPDFAAWGAAPLAPRASQS